MSQLVPTARGKQKVGKVGFFISSVRNWTIFKKKTQLKTTTKTSDKAIKGKTSEMAKPVFPLHTLNLRMKL